MSQNPGQHKILPIRDQRIVSWLGRIWSHKKEREPEPPTFGSFETEQKLIQFPLSFFIRQLIASSLPDKINTTLWLQGPAQEALCVPGGEGSRLARPRGDQGDGAGIYPPPLTLCSDCHFHFTSLVCYLGLIRLSSYVLYISPRMTLCNHAPGQGAHTTAADLPPGWRARQATLPGRAAVRGHGQAAQHHHVPVRGQPASRRHRHPEACRENEVWRDRGRFKFTIVFSEDAVKYCWVSIYSILFLSCRKYYLI